MKQSRPKAVNHPKVKAYPPSLLVPASTEGVEHLVYASSCVLQFAAMFARVFVPSVLLSVPQTCWPDAQLLFASRSVLQVVTAAAVLHAAIASAVGTGSAEHFGDDGHGSLPQAENERAEKMPTVAKPNKI